MEANTPLNDLDVTGTLVKRLHAFCDVHNDAAASVVERICKRLEPVDSESTRQLLQSLNLVTASGKMPSFSDAGARTGYIRKRMEHRSRSLAAALLHSDCDGLRDGTLHPSPPCKHKRECGMPLTPYRLIFARNTACGLDWRGRRQRRAGCRRRAPIRPSYARARFTTRMRHTTHSAPRSVLHATHIVPCGATALLLARPGIHRASASFYAEHHNRTPSYRLHVGAVTDCRSAHAAS
jgi:hypothetical protein